MLPVTLMLTGALFFFFPAGVPATEIKPSPVEPVARGWVPFPLGKEVTAPDTLVHGGPGLAALTTDGGSFEYRSYLWLSRDGRVWKHRRLDPAVFPRSLVDQGVDVGLFGVGSRLLILGWRFDGPTLMWISKDGVTWRPVPTAAPVFGRDTWVNSVTAVGSVLIAAGRSGSNGAIWTSHDGMTWRREPDPTGVFEHSAVVSIVRWNVGFIAAGEKRGAAAVWTSHDGHVWKQVPGNRSVFTRGSAMSAVVVGHHVMLGLGGQDTARGYIPELWASRDGLTWRRASRYPLPNPNPTYVAADGPGFVAVSSEDDESVLRSSRDGLNWKRVGGDAIFGGAAKIGAIIGFKGEVIAVGDFARPPRPYCGSDPPSFEATALVWSRATSRSATPRGPAPLDAKDLRLRGADIGAPKLDGGGYIDACSWLPALGPHTAYSFRGYFQHSQSQYTGWIQGLGIVTANRNTARAALKDASAFITGYPWGYFGKTTGFLELAPPARIGEETRLFSLTIDESCNSSDCEESGPSKLQAYGAVWRAGRAVGLIVADGGNSQEVLRLARRQWERLKRP